MNPAREEALLALVSAGIHPSKESSAPDKELRNRSICLTVLPAKRRTDR